MENFNLLDGSDTLKASRDTINNNLLSVRSLSSGTAFPTDNLSDGMLCYRTDLKRLYQYQENGSWSADIAMNINGNANTANSAGTAATANRATVADSCTGNSATATTAETAETCTGNSATATKLKSAISINNVAFDGTKIINIPVGVKTVNGNAPSADGNVDIAGVPIGFEYISFNPNIPTGSLPLLGGTFSRTAYADLWAWVQTQTGYLISETAWQSKAVSNNGNVPFYSDGDGSTTFRVPSLCCWVKGANGISEVGSYLAAGLPNITGQLGLYGTEKAYSTTSGAFTTNDGSMTYGGDHNKAAGLITDFDASKSNDIYGNSDTVQPESIVGLWLVKAYGSVGVIGTQEAVNIASALDQVEQKMSDYTENVAYIDSFIVESWRSEDGTSWYRRYSDGWIEQGGCLVASSNPQTISMLLPFANDKYNLQLTCGDNDRNAQINGIAVYQHTPSAFTFVSGYNDTFYKVLVNWYAIGQGAE